MKSKMGRIFHKLYCCLFGMPLFLSLVLISCSGEQGDWTAVQQEGEYIYGVWHSATMKKAEHTLLKVVKNIKNASMLSEEPLTIEKVERTVISPEHLLPGDGELLDWVQSRAPSTYQGKTLYRDRPESIVSTNSVILMLSGKTLSRDRAASPDLYYAYGFQRQAEVEYQAPQFGSKPLILLEIFDMGTPENAFGIHNFHTYPQAKFEWVGSKAMLSGGYLRFSKGRYFIQIEGYEFATGIREAMIAIAKAVASEIKDPPPEPRILTLLPSNKLSGSVKLFRSNWALRQIYSTLPVNVPQLSDPALGISARYPDNADSANWVDAQIVFIIRFSDTSAAESAYTLYRDSVMKAAVSPEVGADGAILVNELVVPKAN